MTAQKFLAEDPPTPSPALPSPDDDVHDATPHELELVIEPSRGLKLFNLRELVRYRELLWFLTWRDVTVRYKQTFIGIAWAVLQPLTMMVVFTIFFGRLGRMEQHTGDVPYELFAFAGLLPWQLFSRALTESSQSLVTDQRLITKVYFPRIIVPTATCLAAIVDFAICFVILLGMMLSMGYPPSLRILWLPLLVALMMVTALGVGLWLSALNTEYRDVRYALPFLTQLWMFATPVVYPASIVPDEYWFLIGLNPMTGVVEGLRWCLLSSGEAPGRAVFVSIGFSLVIFTTGLAWFHWRERTFVDHLGGM